MVRKELLGVIHAVGLLVDAVEQTVTSACLFVNAALDAVFDLVVEKG